MRAKYLSLLVAVLLFASCGSNNKRSASNVLGKQHLPSQLFSVDTEKDTVLVTRQGCIIRLPKGSLQSDTRTVELEIREALTNTDMVLAGLTTMSGSQPLSSGGMIYFNAASGYKIEIKKQVEILVPTKTYNRNMQLFRGDSVNAKIDWKDPQPLPKDETTLKIESGEALYKANCASCHKIDQYFTAPPLIGITDRISRARLYALTTHDPRFLNGELLTENSWRTTDTSKLDPVQRGYIRDHMASDSSSLLNANDLAWLYVYHKCLQRKYSPTEMTSFLNLTEKDLDNLYAYVKSESDRMAPGMKPGKDCCDSCADYEVAKQYLLGNRERLVAQNDYFFNLDRDIPIPPVMDTTPPESTEASAAAVEVPYTKITPGNTRGTYYSINILATGWYNIDILLKNYNGCVESELFVRLQENYKIDMTVNLIIPAYKTFVQGGKLKNGKEYGFDENDGRINLPQHTLAYIIAFAEKNDKLIFAKRSFNTQTRQTIELEFREISKEQLGAEIRALKLDDINAEVGESKNAEQLKKIDATLKETEKLKPKNCDCGYLPMAANTTPAVQDNLK